MLVRNHLFKNRVPMLSSALDAYALRQKTIAKNIANVNTPGYIPEKVKFEEEFHTQQEVLGGMQTQGAHLRLGDVSSRKVASEAVKTKVPDAEIYYAGESHVNVDHEMSELAKNQIKTRFASQMLGKYFRGLNSAITGQNSPS